MHPHTVDILQPLRMAIMKGEAEAIRMAIPEPPFFLSTLFKLEPSDRDNILDNVFPVLDTDEDKWELIEAAAMDSLARPGKGAFISIIKHIPASLLSETRTLVAHFPASRARQDIEAMLDTHATD
ncbi:MAG: hypothetical protein IPO81_29675 [Kouleothrix sp.]|nr:hypothetical protein [Kouleothrix sp.]